MSKSKAKSPKKQAPKSGLIVKNTNPTTHSKFGIGGSAKSVSSSKKGNSVGNLPRKAG